MRFARLIAAVLALAPLSACADLPTTCTSDPKYTMRIEVRDARTGAPLAYGSTGTIRDGGYVEQMTSSEGMIYLWAGSGDAGRPGTYDVTIERPGYETWRRSDVRVSGNHCGPRVVDLVANLTPID